MCAVAVVKCKDYDIPGIRAALDEAIGLIGGMKAFVKQGSRVALKPNLVRRATPDESATTHPGIIEVLASMVTEAGGRPFIIDSPGVLFNNDMLPDYYRATGMSEAAEKSGAALDYDMTGITIDNPRALYLKKIPVLKSLAEADVIINVPKLKTHWLMGFSCAVKNMFGAVPGLLKAEYHLRMSEYDMFADVLIDTFLAVKPALNIVDAVVGMEGNGPTAGNSRQIGLIIAGCDGFEVDIASSAVIGIDPQLIYTVRRAFERGLCACSQKDINILGAGIDGNIIDDYDVPQIDTLHSVQFFQRGALKLLANLVKPKPVFLYDKCKGCGKCEQSCPARIIRLKGGKPRLDRRKCIKCFCCQEFCPSKAVAVKRVFPVNLLFDRENKQRNFMKRGKKV